MPDFLDAEEPEGGRGFPIPRRWWAIAAVWFVIGIVGVLALTYPPISDGWCSEPRGLTIARAVEATSPDEWEFESLGITHKSGVHVGLGPANDVWMWVPAAVGRDFVYTPVPLFCNARIHRRARMLYDAKLSAAITQETAR